MNTIHETTPVVGAPIAAVSEPLRRRISWGAILGGTVVGVATIIMLGLLGTAIGLWAVEPGGETDTVGGMAAATGIYFAIVQLVALAVGGYVASRMSATYDRQNAFLHGVVVWAVSTVATVWLAASAAGSIVNASVSAVTGTASALASVASAVVPDELPDFSMPDIEMEDLPPRIRTALRNQGMTADNLKSEAQEAFRNVISQREQRNAQRIATDAAVDIIRNPGDATSAIESAIDRLVGEGGVVSEEDRKQLLAEMRTRLGITEAEAEQMLEKWQNKAQQALADAQAALEEARREAVQALDNATDAVGTTAMWAFVALVLGLFAAGFGAKAGRRKHPIEEIELRDDEAAV